MLAPTPAHAPPKRLKLMYACMQHRLVPDLHECPQAHMPSTDSNPIAAPSCREGRMEGQHQQPAAAAPSPAHAALQLILLHTCYRQLHRCIATHAVSVVPVLDAGTGMASTRCS